MPSWRSGSEIAAPSGKFCMPMPAASAIAEAYAAGFPACCAASANDSPTAIPSGILCNVTAITSKEVRFIDEDMPSVFFMPGCRCGISRSSTYKNTMPRINPPAAASHPVCPPASASSIAGISRLHTEAAIMTPAANPRNTFCTLPLMVLLKRNTIAAPSAVIEKVNPVPATAHNNASAMSYPSLQAFNSAAL